MRTVVTRIRRPHGEPEKRARRYRDAVEPYLRGENLEAVGPFSRPEKWHAGSGLGDLIGPFVFLYDKWMESRAGRLPRRFLLAITRDNVHAFKFWERDAQLSVEQAGVFARDDIKFSWESRGRLWSDAVALHVTSGGLISQIVDIDADKLDRDPLATEVFETLRDQRLDPRTPRD